MILQPLVPLDGHINIAPYEGSQVPKKTILGAWIGVFKLSAQNIKTFILSKILQRFQPNLAQR